MATVKPPAIFRIFSGNSSASIDNMTSVVPTVKNRSIQNSTNGTTEVVALPLALLSYDLTFAGRYKNP